MVGSNLYHPVVILSTQVHKVIVDRIDYLTFYMNFIMQVRACTLSRTAYPANNFTAYHLLADLSTEITQMRVYGLITKSMIYHNPITISGLPPHLYHRTISCGINIRT